MLPNTQNFKNVPQQYFVLALFGVLNLQELQFQKKKRKVKQYFFGFFKLFTGQINDFSFYLLLLGGFVKK